MGESAMDDAPVLRDADKMGEEKSASNPNPVLEVSISFGRFEKDALSWEKWSTFSPNKYLEEVEKCATPGSVAQKKAYFEAHYKKIAARKAELEEAGQEKMETDDPLRSCEEQENSSSRSSSGDLITAPCGSDSEAKHEIDSDGEVNSNIMEHNTNESISVEENKLRKEEEEEEEVLEKEVEAPTTATIEENVERKEEEEAVLENEVKAATTIIEEKKESKEEEKAVLEKEVETTTTSLESLEMKEEAAKLDPDKKSNMVTSTNKERYISTLKRNPVPPIAKLPESSTRKSFKKMPSSTVKETEKKGSDSFLSRRKKNPSLGENKKKAAPKSLHMSIGFESRDSDLTSLTPIRKSLIMERMGDKDIVKRAFKTFQNNLTQLKSSIEERSSIPKQAPLKRTESRSTSSSRQKENGGLHKTSAVDNRSGKVVSTFGKKSDEKQTEFSKKLEGKSSARKAERTPIPSKLRMQKETEIKKLRQSLNFKATPLPAFYGAQTMSKSTPWKEDSKNSKS